MDILGPDTSKEGRQVQSQEWKWFPWPLGVILSLGSFFSDAHLVGQLANQIIDQIFETELKHENGLDGQEMRRNEIFRPKFAKIG